MAKISSIIPVYNSGAELRMCLNSALRQRDVELDVVCIADCSTDGSAKILSEAAHVCPQIRVLRQPKNSGQGAARNRGLELAAGEFAYFMDADDELVAPDALSRLVEVMDRERLEGFSSMPR